MSFNRVVVVTLLLLAGIGGALACGPNFPWQLLNNRDQAVSDRVELDFAFEATRLVDVRGDGPRAVERDDANLPEAVVSERAEVRSGAWRGLLAGAVDIDMLEAKLDAARSANDGDAVLSAGAGLPIAVVTYIAGAIEFRADRLDTAMRYFEAIDRLPLDQRQIRVVAAAYMRGRIEQRLGSMELARAAFQATRQHAQAGAPDPMGLAVASLGEEARTDLAEARLIEVPWPVTVSDPDEARFTRLVADAVRLYADQAARGSKMALLSLNEVARRLIARDELKFAVADPFVRRLLVVYVVSREHDYAETAGVKDPVVVVVSEAILSQPAPAAGRDLDRLAALAYQGGRYELAERLTVAPNQPLGLWVRAKLALRRGDRAAAVRDWTAALTATENTGDAATLDANSTTRLRGELAVVRLSQGEYRDSLRLLFPVAGTYWGDVAYITERVLTVDELKAFIDGLPAPREVAPSTDDGFWSSSFSPVANLRALLARRLVRDGRVGEALAYFPPPAAGSTSAPGSTSDQPSGDRATVDDARDYRAAVEAARPGWPFDWPWQTVARSEALFKVATLTRQQGMGLMGTEGPPDETVLFGSFPGGVGQASPAGLSKSPSALLGPDEASRFAASAPTPDTRFHYRAIAADRAAAAADLLPQRSQAYAATLCWAARYAIDSSDQAKADAIYRRYVANGAHQAWARDFGRTCPPPDFEGARTFWTRRITAWVTQIAGSVWRHITLIAVVAIALLSAAVWGRRALRGRRS
jgi:cellulose synthase operon protein C